MVQPLEWIFSRDRELDELLPDAGCRPQCGLGCHNQRDHSIRLAQVEGDFFLAIPEILAWDDPTSAVGLDYPTKLASQVDQF